MAAPIGFLFVGHRYVTFIRSFAVYQLLITLVIWISPMPVTASLLFGLSFAGGFLSLVNVLESAPGIARVITTLIFAGLLATIYFPSIRGKFDSQIVAMNEPSIVQIYPGDLKSGKIKLFLSGKPNKWYSLTPEGKYELFDLPGHNDLYQDELKPVTSEIARKLIDNENFLSRRNLQNIPSPPLEVKVTPNTTATAPTYVPPPAKVAPQQKLKADAERKQAQATREAQRQAKAAEDSQQKVPQRSESIVPPEEVREKTMKSMDKILEELGRSPAISVDTTLSEYLRGRHIQVLFIASQLQMGAEIVYRLRTLGANVEYELILNEKAMRNAHVSYNWNYLQAAQAIQAALQSIQPLELERDDSSRVISVWIS